MKRFMRDFVFHVFSLWLASQLLPAILVVGSWMNFFIAGFVLTILVYIVQPFLKILFIPINLITFGLLSWFVHVIILYLLTLFVPEIMVRAYTLPGGNYAGFVVPPIYLNYITALIAAALLITTIAETTRNLSD